MSGNEVVSLDRKRNIRKEGKIQERVKLKQNKQQKENNP